MEFQHKLMVVQEINLITREVVEKQTNLIPSFTIASSIISLNIKVTTLMTTLIRTQLNDV
jgi:hypothetical protein